MHCACPSSSPEPLSVWFHRRTASSPLCRSLVLKGWQPSPFRPQYNAPTYSNCACSRIRHLHETELRDGPRLLHHPSSVWKSWPTAAATWSDWKHEFSQLVHHANAGWRQPAATSAMHLRFSHCRLQVHVVLCTAVVRFSSQ